MVDHASLRRLLASLVPLGLSAAGCGGIGDFPESVCLTDTALGDMKPAAGTDFIALRERNSAVLEEVKITSTWGKPCASAADADACAAALADLPILGLFSESSPVSGSVSYDVAFTRGDEVDQIATRTALVSLLATIDTPPEAALLARVDGHHIACGEGNVRREGDGFVVRGHRGSSCGEGDIEEYEIIVAANGAASEGESEVVGSGDANCTDGRRPATLRSRARRVRAVGDAFAMSAHLEAASVPAFEALAAELHVHGAPTSLVVAALRSRADEVRHAITTARLARRYGGRPVAPVIGPRAVRGLYAVALENVVEGCVRETFGALVARVQAVRAVDPAVRRSMRRIAADETRHAALAWAVDAWARRLLPSRQRRELVEARREAVATLREDVAAPVARAVELLTGRPGPEASTRMIDALEASLWRA